VDPVRRTLELARDSLVSKRVSFAVIGGLALAAYGVGRPTFDVDLLVDGAQREEAERALVQDAGFEVFFSSPEVLQLSGHGALDLLFAHRPPTRAMLAAARPNGPLGTPCVRPEDLVGLKIQAMVNDPRRALRDRADMLELFRGRPDLDWDAIKKYAEVFGRWNEIQALRRQV